jgi:hypothetical protein
MRPPSRRRGYALVLVMIFVVFFSAVLGVAWRRVSSALRIEHVCELRKQCDAGTIQVLAQAMQVLETRLRSDNTGVASLDVSSTSTPDYRPASYLCKSTQQYTVPDDPVPRWYIVKFTCESPADGAKWEVTVSVAPPSEDFNSSSLPPLPSSPP